MRHRQTPSQTHRSQRAIVIDFTKSLDGDIIFKNSEELSHSSDITITDSVYQNDETKNHIEK